MLHWSLICVKFFMFALVKINVFLWNNNDHSKSVHLTCIENMLQACLCESHDFTGILKYLQHEEILSWLYIVPSLLYLRHIKFGFKGGHSERHVHLPFGWFVLNLTLRDHNPNIPDKKLKCTVESVTMSEPIWDFFFLLLWWNDFAITSNYYLASVTQQHTTIHPEIWNHLSNLMH